MDILIILKNKVAKNSIVNNTLKIIKFEIKNLIWSKVGKNLCIALISDIVIK
jgi:hypothetical protein